MANNKLKHVLAATTVKPPFKAFIVSTDGEIVEQTNDDISMTHLERIASRLAHTFQPDSSSQVQFLQASLPANELILYSCRLEADLLLTVAAMTETSVIVMRQQAEQIVRAYLDAQIEEKPAASGVLVHRPVNGTRASCYAIIWQPEHALPKALHTALQQILNQLAETNGCKLHHLAIQADYIQILVACPPGRNSAWAAHLFKSGSEQSLQKRYHTETALWRPGYYASETKSPLPEEQLKRIFQRNR